MTIVSTIITSGITIHAADSLLTRPKFNNDGKVIGFSELTRKARKIVRVPAYAGAMSFWGLARLGWLATTHQWLNWQLGECRNRSPEEFANRIAEKLQDALSGLHLAEDAYYGIGIHFTVYENQVPELFLITNYLDETYEKVDRTRVHVSRHTYLKTSQYDGTGAEVHGAQNYRDAVREYLEADYWNWLMFNNGDPAMFCPFAFAMLREFKVAGQRLNLNVNERKQLLKTLATMPIEAVSKVQQSVYKKDQQLVGAPVRWLAIRPVGTYESSTGD